VARSGLWSSRTAVNASSERLRSQRVVAAAVRRRMLSQCCAIAGNSTVKVNVFSFSKFFGYVFSLMDSFFLGFKNRKEGNGNVRGLVVRCSWKL
jgi:hypothetical protein